MNILHLVILHVVVRMSDLAVKSFGTIDFLLIIKYTISLFILTCFLMLKKMKRSILVFTGGGGGGSYLEIQQSVK